MTLSSPEHAQLPAGFGGLDSNQTADAYGGVAVVPFGINGIGSLKESSLSTEIFLKEDLSAIGADGPIVEYFETSVNEAIPVSYNANPRSMQGTIYFHGRVVGTAAESCINDGPNPTERLRFQRRLQSGGAWQDDSQCVLFGETNNFFAHRLLFGGTGFNVGLNGDSCDVWTESYLFLNGYDYRIAPNRDPASPDAVRCLLDGNPNPPLVADDGVVLRIGNCCPWDIDGSGATDSADMNFVLAVFGAADACDFNASYYHDKRGDVDGDNDVDSADLNKVLEQFGLPCNCGSGAGGGGGGGGGGPNGGGAQAMALGGPPAQPSGDIIAQAFGFATVAQYMQWLNSLPPNEQLEHIAELQLVLEALVDAGVVY